MRDVFDKCRNIHRVKALVRSINKSVSVEHRWGLDDHYIDHHIEDILDIFYSTAPINNGGPLISHRGRSWIQFCANNYLGMATHPEVINVAADYAAVYGIGSPMGSRMLGGTTELHLELERQIADFKKTEGSLTFSVGANAMIGSVSALVSPMDVIISDELAHASLNCGAVLSRAKVERFKHNDLNQLEDILKKVDPKRGKLVIVDGVYSMNGDVAPLVEICDLKDKYHARLFVDDAHGNGTLGNGGGGVAEVQGVEHRIDIHAGTFSKAFGLQGGFIASNKDVVTYLRHMANTTIFTKSQPAVIVAATIKALDIGRKATDLRQKLHDNAQALQTRLVELGFNIGDTVTPITPIAFPGLQAVLLCEELRRDYAIWVQPVIFPAVPISTSLIRVIPTAMHTKEQIEYFCNCLYDVYDRKMKLFQPVHHALKQPKDRRIYTDASDGNTRRVYG
ncbi:MAG: aminotransferase class I/II-fold pyridoxal phosphate-dependent enzyme [Proteobacteria bacterium]|nr:aminotransferase class I/II-fold pyridoxal phosphate-dependent enzyme [Pseudomonadota bacterium]